MASPSPVTSITSGEAANSPTTVDTVTPIFPRKESAQLSLALWRRHLAIIFGLALGLRIVVVLWLHFAPKAYQPAMAIFAADALAYDLLAKHILHGQGYQLDGNYAEITRIPPLFSFFLAGLYALCGTSVVGTGLANALLGALTAVCLYYLVRRCLVYYQASPTANAAQLVTAERIACIAACLFAVYPLEIFNTPYVLKENFSIFLTVGFALAWAQLLPVQGQQPTRWWAIATGVLLGLSVLSRYTHIGLALVFVVGNLWWCWRNRQALDELSGSSLGKGLLFHTGIAVLFFGLTLTPWLARNYNVFGQVILSPHGPARYLYNANSNYAAPETNGYYEGHGDSQQWNQYTGSIDATTEQDMHARERTYASAALQNLKRPLHVAQLIGGKLISMWRPVWADSSLRTWLLLGVPYIVMMALALPGLCWWRRDQVKVARESKGLGASSSMVLYLMILYYFLGHAAFWGMVRERQYVEPYLIAFAAYAFCRLIPKSESN